MGRSPNIKTIFREKKTLSFSKITEDSKSPDIDKIVFRKKLRVFFLKKTQDDKSSDIEITFF